MDAAVWDAALRKLPQPHILQSWAWAALKAQTGWQARRLLWQAPAGTPVAAAGILTRRLARGVPGAVAYVPKGPLLDWSDARSSRRSWARSRPRRGGSGRSSSN